MSKPKALRVLLVEDDQDYRRLLVHQLARESTNFLVDWVGDAAAAEHRVSAIAYDAVLADLTLPDSQGPEVVERLKKCCEAMPIIVLTGLVDTETEKAIVATCGQDYLVKGDTTGAEIVRAIQHAIHRQQALNENRQLLEEITKSHRKLEEQAAQLRRKNRRLRRLNRMAHEFVDNVSHDLRTPLTVIKDYVSLIREGLVGEINDDQRGMLDKVSVRADDLNNMVDDLLDVSKIDAGLLGCWRRGVDPAQVTRRPEPMLAQRAAVKGVALTVEPAADLPQVYCDAEKVERVITNLVVNAIKFTPSGGSVRLWAEPDPVGQQVVIGVTDNGTGIDLSSLKALFERFKQETANSASGAKGFGLGLSIAQRLCRLNLGELSVRSSVGNGSTFSFTVPYNCPVEVFQRWLDLRKATPTAAELVELSLEEESTAGEFDHFVNALLRRDDLLLRIAPNRWLLVLTANPSEAEQWRKRFDKETTKANRNRPRGPLPDCRIESLAVWDADAPVEQRVGEFRSVLNRSVSHTAEATISETTTA